MAGGMIPQKNIPLLGRYPRDVIRDAFLQVLTENGQRKCIKSLKL